MFLWYVTKRGGKGNMKINRESNNSFNHLQSKPIKELDYKSSNEEDVMSLYQRQLELEEESVNLGIKRYRKQVESTPISELPPGLSLMYRTLEPFRVAIEEFVTSARGRTIVLQTKAFLADLADKDYYDVAFIVAKELINTIGEVRNIQTASITIFNRLADHKEYLKVLKEHPAYLNVLEEEFKRRNAGVGNRRYGIMRAKRRNLGIEDTDYSNLDRAGVGSKLIDLFITSTGLVERVQSLETSQWLLQGTPEVIEWIVKHNAKSELMSPVMLPMLIPPIPWDSPYGGGFVNNCMTGKLKLIKTHNRDALEALGRHEMPKVYESINHLQNTPWRVNKKVLEVLNEVHRLDNGLADLPQTEEIPLPPTPWKNDEEFKQLKANNPEVVRDWKNKSKDIYERRIIARSKLLALVHKLWVAEKFEKEKEFYFVWTMDWRGRLYPVQPYLNPQGDDVSKSLLEFAKGKPLGERGAYWLKVHLANCFGIDKVSFEERVEWTEENAKLIIDSAKNPLDGLRFWTEADEPWQFLAGCFEYLGYTHQGNEYISHLPINMDGSCNGIQNFSAMLLDEVGGNATNLVPQNNPQDVYSEVMNVVIEKVKEDYRLNNNEYAKLWLGKIDRNIVKRPVMTLPYGVKLFGIRDQLLDELKKREVDYLDTDGDNFHACMYLANILWDSIGEVVVASRSAMDWLQEVAGIVAHHTEEGITWTTPIGFLVLQKYVRRETKTIRTFWGINRVRVQLSIASDTNKLDKLKQRNGISPNFVHSMDASHLMLTILKAKEHGIESFNAIHDSYGTHACDLDKLNALLRQAFVEQYSEHDVLKEFQTEVLTQLEGGTEEEEVTLPQIPLKGNLKLEEVVNSPYFFS